MPGVVADRNLIPPSVRCSLPGVVQEGTDTEQKRCKGVSFLAKIEKPNAGQNAYEDHSHNFEHWRFGRLLPQVLEDYRIFANASAEQRSAARHQIIG
jgi:hypothetical protein